MVKQLYQVATLKLPYYLPFNFRYTLWKPSHFRTNLECHSETVSWRTFRFGETLCGVRFEIEHDKLIASVFANKSWNKEICEKLVQRIDHAYGLHEDISSFVDLAKKNDVIGDTLRKLAGMRMSCPESLFEIAIISLLLQNTTVARSTQMMGKLLSNYGKKVEFDGQELLCFFSPEDMMDITEQELREICRLGYRAKYLPAFAHYFAKHDPDLFMQLDRESIMAELQSIKGVGPYTAGVIASHALRDTEAVGLDTWNRKIVAKALLELDDAEPDLVLAKLKELFPGYPGTALMYLVENEYINSPVVPLISEKTN